MYFDRRKDSLKKFNFLCVSEKKALFSIVSFLQGPEMLPEIKINTSALHQKNIK